MQSFQNAAFITSQRHHFTRLFPELDPLYLPDEALIALAESMRPAPNTKQRIGRGLTNGASIFGQFLAHDITFEVSSSFKNLPELAAIENERTINFDLDCLYGQRNQSFYYDRHDNAKFLLGQQYHDGTHSWNDLPRNTQEHAIIPDARNDENIIVSQMHVLFMRFHNRVVDELRENGDEDNVFEKARNLVTWHYHWLIIQEYLVPLLDLEIFVDLFKNGCKYYTRPHALPLEFTGAAFRVGHSQSPDQVQLSETMTKPLFELGHFNRMDQYIDWRYLFDFADGKVNFAPKIDTVIAEAFHDLPFVNLADPFLRSLAGRNLKRGNTYGLPSGEAVAQRMGYTPIYVEEKVEMRLPGTPLWFYILREAELLNNGDRLGPVGSRLLGECFLTILLQDDKSYLKTFPKWRPTLGGHPWQFTFADLINFVEVKIKA